MQLRPSCDGGRYEFVVIAIGEERRVLSPPFLWWPHIGIRMHCHGVIVVCPFCARRLPYTSSVQHTQTSAHMASPARVRHRKHRYTLPPQQCACCPLTGTLHLRLHIYTFFTAFRCGSLITVLAGGHPECLPDSADGFSCHYPHHGNRDMCSSQRVCLTAHTHLAHAQHTHAHAHPPPLLLRGPQSPHCIHPPPPPPHAQMTDPPLSLSLSR